MGVEGDIYRPNSLMIKVSYDNVWPKKGEVVNFILIMRREMSSKGEEL